MAGASFCLPGVAQAQRTSENIVTQSADAFGKAIGSERIGLYSPDDIRGFNPIDAGNVRIEGLYFDHIERVPVRLVEGSTVRVGIAARGYPTHGCSVRMPLPMSQIVWRSMAAMRGG